MQSLSNILAYQSRKRLTQSSSGRTESSPRPRHRRSTATLHTPSQPAVGTSAENDASNNSRHDCVLAWGELRRRDPAVLVDGAVDPVLRFAISQLQGAMVTGCHNNGFNAWPEEDHYRLSDLIYKIWEEMARDRQVRSRNRAEPINTIPTHPEARKVVFQ
jgi:hypothetical protein